MGKNIYPVPCIYEKTRGSRLREPLLVSVPGSKSITNRALLLATLAEGESTLRDVLFSDDSRHFLKCIQDLGFETAVEEERKIVTVTGLGGKLPVETASLYVGSAGTAARFLTAYLGLSKGVFHMDASPQMRKRPMAPLLDSLAELGCEIEYEGEHGHFPFTLKGHGFGRNQIAVNIDESSQFMSALLIVSCLSEENFTAVTEGFHGRAYIEMTVKMMRAFGVEAAPLYYCAGQGGSHDCSGCVNSTIPYAYQIRSGQRYHALDCRIQPDISAACYFYAMSPLLGVPVQVAHVHRGSDFLQGDIAFLGLLEEMGCKLENRPEGALLLPPENGVYHGVNVDMSSFSDQAITLAAIAPFADSPTTIRGVGHMRFQESNRIAAIVTELRRMGIRCETHRLGNPDGKDGAGTGTVDFNDADAITIYPGTPSPAAVETYEDHRMAMGFSLTGLRAPGIVINDPGCCKKTFETYFDVLDQAVAALTKE